MFLLFVVSSLAGCMSQKTEEQNVNLNLDVFEEIGLSEFSNYELLPISTPDSVLIGNVVSIHRKGNNIYLCDKYSVYKLDENGGIEAVLCKQGEGPGEYYSITDFQIDGNGDVWILSRRNKSVLLYDWAGKVKGQISLDFWSNNMALLDNKMYFFTGNEITDESQSNIQVIDLNSGDVIQSFNPINPQKSKYLHIAVSNPFIKKGNGFYYTEMFNDTIFSLTDDEFKPARILDLGGHNVPSSFLNNEYANVMDFFQALQPKGYAYGVTLYQESDKWKVLGYVYKKGSHLNVFDNASGESRNIDSFNLDSHNMIIPIAGLQMFAQSEKEFIVPIEVSSFLEYGEDKGAEIQEKIKKDIKFVSEDQNPVLLIVRLK